jgi:hypothetical protein
MDDLIAFLRARWDDEEAEARSAAEVYGARWWWNPSWGLVKGDPDNDPEATSIFSIGEENVAEVWSEVGPHIARHDPSRALREVEAKRKVVEEYAEALRVAGGYRETRYEEGRREALELVCRAYGAAYADRSDYRPEWKP